MIKIHKRPSHQTVTVEPGDREAINRLAQELDIPQRKVVSLLLDVYNKSQPHSPPDQVIEAITDSRDQIIKRIDTVISFIKEQEKVLLKPMLSNDQVIYSLLKSGTNELLTNQITIINEIYDQRR